LASPKLTSRIRLLDTCTILMSFFLWPLHLISGSIRLVFGTIVLASCALTLLAWLAQSTMGLNTPAGEQNWIWSLTTHFRMQYLTVQLVAIGALLLSYVLRCRKSHSLINEVNTTITLIFLMAFAGLNLISIMPYYLSQAEATAPQGNVGKQITLLHCNLFGLINRDTRSVAETIRTVDPDLLDLVEYTEFWQHKLEHSGVLKRYPYRVAGRGHIALYSKLPLSNARLVFVDPSQKVANQANIIANFKLNRKLTTIVVAHPASPILPSHLAWLRECFQSWASQRKQLGRNLIIVGDLNTTPWSGEFAELTQKTGLRDSQLGFGVQPSWPMLLPLLGVRETPNWLTGLLQIPIDHVLVSPSIQVLSRRTGPFVGSDHLPVIVELGLKPL
jgi:endonuclease/exonuclease/phosphatase (EEP) superfamily protein YafD